MPTVMDSKADLKVTSHPRRHLYHIWPTDKNSSADRSPGQIPLYEKNVCFAQAELAPPSLVTHWANRSAPAVSGQTSGRLKRKYVPIDITSYQHVGGLADCTSPSCLTRICNPVVDQDLELDPLALPKPLRITQRSPEPRGLSDQRDAVLASPSSIQPSILKARASQPRLRHEKRQLRASESLLQINLPSHSAAALECEAGKACSTMNQSNTSLSDLKDGRDENEVPRSAVSATAQVGISSASPQVGGTGPTNLSGLVCNVHRTTGQEPHALVGATTTILGDKLYVFGGRILSRTRPHLTSDLYELDLIRRHWKKLETSGDIPPPRYFHSVCALGDAKLVCYGGMTPSVTGFPSNTNSQQPHHDPQPEVVVASDIHIYDVPSQTWTLIATTNNPQGRYAHCAAILPSSAVFTSANAPLSAIHHNPPSSNPHSGTLGVKLDGTGGAEMVVVGGQDSANKYIEQVSVFNLRSLEWTATNSLGRSCGAYRSVVAPLVGMSVDDVGGGNNPEVDRPITDSAQTGSAVLIYSNYNFLDVKLELQIRLSDGRLVEKAMAGTVSPPGLRFPNGGVLDNHFVVSGTYLTSSKQEYELWAMDLRNLTWGRIDAGGTVFGQGSWNRGVVWNRRNTFVILGRRTRNLVEDYNHRRINFSHICMVELEAFGLYDNPRKSAPTSDYVSVSSVPNPSGTPASLEDQTGGGRPFSAAAEHLGQALLGIAEFADMDLIGIDGEKVPVNSYLLSRRWGPYFDQLLSHSTAASQDNWSVSDALTLRPQMNSQASRNSSLTITGSIANMSTHSTTTTINATTTSPNGIAGNLTQSATRQALNAVDFSEPGHLPPSSRPRALYLPHTSQTLRLLTHYLYASSLPSITNPLCTPQSLCSLLQLARPYQINGLLEATVERLHEVLDGRNAAAVFNASAMAAGGGRALGEGTDGTLAYLQRRESEANGVVDDGQAPGQTTNTRAGGLRINTSFDNGDGGTRKPAPFGHQKTDSVDSTSTATSVSTSTDFSHTDSEATGQESGEHDGKSEHNRQVWMGGVSSVIGLQKRGLRGLMEGRRLRERANTGLSAVEGTAPFAAGGAATST